jgi:acyl-coenzyme A thioesterase PaaI-like protein
MDHTQCCSSAISFDKGRRFADSAAAVAILTICGSRSQIATTDMNIRFLAQAQSEVRVYARVIKAAKTLVPVSVDLWDSRDQLVAIAQMNYMRLNQDKL